MAKLEKSVSDVSVSEIKAEDILQYADMSLDNELAFLNRWHNISSNFVRVKNGMVLLICRSGQLTLSINSKQSMIGRNDLLIWSPNVVIGNTVASSDFKCTTVFLSGRFVEDYVLICNRRIAIKDFFVHPVVNLGQSAIDTFDKYYSFISDRLEDKDNPYLNNIVKSLAGALFYELFSFAEQYSSAEGNEMSSARHCDAIFKKFVGMLQSDNVKRRSVASYAKDLCITPKYLSVICKDKTGKTAMDFINNFVMQDVRRLLVYSDKSIKEISNELGFPNVSFFGKYVRMHSGMTPRQMRTSEL